MKELPYLAGTVALELSKRRSTQKRAANSAKVGRTPVKVLGLGGGRLDWIFGLIHRNKEEEE